MIDLAKPDLTKVEIGTLVMTTKGFVWKLLTVSELGQSWLDETSGLTWFPKENGTFNHYQAVEQFQSSFPTKEEFEKAEEHGIREIFNDFQNEWFWSASVHPSFSYYAYFFNGSNGDIDYYYRYDYYVSVRCVAR